MRSDIEILVFFTFCIEVQGKFVGLSMKCSSPLFSGIEHDIDLIVSIIDINPFLYNLRGRKISTQACTPPCNCTKEYYFWSSDSLSDEVYNSFVYNLRGHKTSTQACTPPCHCTKEYYFWSSDSLSGVIEVSNLFANCKRSNASLHFKFVLIFKLCHKYIIKNIKFKTLITLWRIILYTKLYICGFLVYIVFD